jgi:hypothetical protein
VYSEYDIDARLDPITGLLSGTETVRFHNRSPQALPVLQLFLHQNLHKPGVARNRAVEVTGGIRLGRVKAGGKDLLPLPGFQGAGYRDPDGVMSIRLPEPLAPGAAVDLQIDWSFVVPQNGAGRMGHSDREMYFLAYWFPKIAVLDDLRGWDAEPYQGAEFYEGYGDYRVRVTVPQGWTAMATGVLQNPEEVYSPRTVAKMAAAAVADTMVQIATREDVEAGRVTRLTETGALTYWFEAENVRDFTWTTSNMQLWTGTSALVPDRDGDGQDDRVAIHSFFREYRAPLWTDQALYGKHSIESESRYTGFPYPWPHMTSVEGADIIGGGMEFPMLTLIGDYQGADPVALYSVTAHELAHMWIPMIVGANEKRHAWIDEGSTTFLENQVKTEYWPGIPDPDAAEMENYLQVTRLEGEQSMMRHGDYYEPGAGYGTASYPKPASLLVTLRLDWFWSSFYYQTWSMDHAVGSVARDGEDTVITIEDRGFAFLPARVTVELEGGEVLERQVPVSHWLTGAASARVRIPGSVGAVVAVELDPSGQFPDVDRDNNRWVRR